MRRILLFLSIVVLAGCFESKQEFFINPDGSGKVILEAWIDTSTGIQMGKAKDDAQQMQDAVKEILQKSEGVEAWKDITYSRAADGRVNFKGTAYFKDLSRLKITNYSTPFWWSKEGKVMTIQMKDENEKKEGGAAPAEVSDEQLQAQIKQAKSEWKRTRCLMESVLSGMKKDARLRLPGKVLESNNFVKEADNIIQVNVDGAKMMEAIDQMMNDEAWLTEQARSGSLDTGGPGSGPPMDEAMNAQLFGQPGPVMAKVQLASKPLFDYKKEAGSAVKAYPKVLESLNMGAKPAAATVVKQGIQFEAGEIRDTRTNGEFFGGLNVDLVMSGDVISQSRKIRNIEIQKAVDNTGQTLLEESQSGSPGFSHSPAGDEEGKKKERLSLKNPARNATSISEISGSVELYVPAKDPKAKGVVKSFLKQTGKPLVSDFLKKSKIEIVVLTKAQYDEMKQAEDAAQQGESQSPLEGIMSGLSSLFGMLFSVDENDLAFLVKDPGERFADLEVLDATGNPIPSRGRSSSGNTYVLSYEQLPPDTSQLAVYLETPTSLVKAPFSLTNVTLP